MAHEPTTDEALREAQRQERIRRGHEDDDGLGIRRDGAGVSHGLTTTNDDETLVMLRQIAKARRGR